MSDLPNASSFDPQAYPSFADVYGDVENGSPYKMRTENSMLPEGFRDIQVWKDLYDSIDEVFGANIGTLIRDLLGMNDIGYLTRSPTISKETLLKQAKDIGVTSDLSMFETQDIKNFIRYAPEFWKEKGTRNFAQYMSFVINAFVSLRYLWTEDYVNFVPNSGIDTDADVVPFGPPRPQPIWAGGTWYPTSHVNVVYDAAKFAGSVNSNFSSQQALTKFFYSIAPIHLVIKSFLVDFYADFDLNFAISTQSRVWQESIDAPPTKALRMDAYPYFRPLGAGPGVVTFDWNKVASASGVGTVGIGSQIAVSRRTYGEFFIHAVPDIGEGLRVGFMPSTHDMTQPIGGAASGPCVRSDGNFMHNAVAVLGFGARLQEADIVSWAYNPATQNLWFGLNGTFTGDPVTGANPTFSDVVLTNLAVSFENNEGVVSVHLHEDEFRYDPPVGYDGHLI